MTLLLLGATGLVGRELLGLALADARVGKVAAPTRRPLPAHPKLVNPTGPDLGRLAGEAALWPADAVACALGTTIAKAGSREAFSAVDHDLPLAFARAARERGTPTFALVSSKGASPRSAIFYSRVKGELERDLTALGFPSLYLARPNFIAGDRTEPRAFEGVVRRVLGGVAPVLPKGLRANPAENLARALLEAAVAPQPGVRVAESATFV